MDFIRTQYTRLYAPRTISKELLKSLIGSLSEFKVGLPTVYRKIKARAISHEKITDLEGTESWKVTDPHSLLDIEHLQIELLLASTDHRSCELHVEFRSEHVLLSVSDIETGWGKGVFEDMVNVLAAVGISSKDLKAKLTRAYSFLDILQNVFLSLSVALFAIWLTANRISFLHASLALFLSGVIPALRRSFYLLVPPRKVPVIQDMPPGRKFPWVEATAVLSFFSALITLVKEMLSILW